MKTYDEETKEEISDPDLSLGYLYEGTIVMGHIEEHKEVMEGTITDKYPMGWRHVIPSHDILEKCMYYHAYTESDRKQAISKKIEELKKAKDSAIQNGADVTLSDGTQKHFFYGVSEQTDISTMFNSVMLGMDSYIYHSGDGCDIYGKEDIMRIHSTLSSLKTKEETYYGQLAKYVNTLATVPEIQNVTYGMELTWTYLKEYNRLLAYAMTQMQNLIERLTANVT